MSDLDSVDLNGLAVYTMTTLPHDFVPITREQAAAQWEERARANGWRPVGAPEVLDRGTRFEINGYVVRQEGVRDITRRMPVRGGQSLAEDRAQAIAIWEQAVRDQGQVAAGPMTAGWIPPSAYAGPAWEVTGTTRPVEERDTQSPKPPIGESGPLVIELRKNRAGLWLASFPGRAAPSVVMDTIEGVVTVLVQDYDYGPNADVHLAVADDGVYPGADHKLCGRPVWLGRMPDIGTYDCALPAGHDHLCIPSASDVRHQIDRAAQRRAARLAAGSTTWRDR